jgi:cysteinyl-tRNA synthetase
MPLRVTNTLSGETERFEPADEDGAVLLYLCGLTTSDPAHLGHARTWVHTDVIHRWLAHLGYEVRHIENFTDVNEKIVARVGEDDLGESERAVAERHVESFLRDMRGLNLLRAEVYPRVTEHVPEILDLIETLVEEGYAYESGGSVYFDTTSFPQYGQLSNQDPEEMEAQGPEAERAEKRHPQDFALWKAGGVAPGEVAEHRHEGAAPPEEACATAMTWDSPWGEGRPGWHIECSAMSMAHLASTIDIHVAGRDLVFPHNENETAQSEAATGQRFARYWLHTGLLETGGEKMSSSLGNFSTVEDALAEIGPDVLRTFFLASQYATRQTFTEEAIVEAERRWERLARAYERAAEALDSADARTKAEDGDLRRAVGEARTDFREGMNEDFNTRRALAALDELADAVNRHLAVTSDAGAGVGASTSASTDPGTDADIDAESGYDYRGLRRAVSAFDDLGGGVLGLQFGGEESAGGGKVDLAADLVELLLEVRERERVAGNYEHADELREELAALGVTVEDSDDGPTYHLP